MAEAMHGSQSSSQVLGSRIGRRLIALFISCALFPLAVFAYVALTQVSSQLTAETEKTLHIAAKAAGMDFASRAMSLAADFALAREFVSNAASPGDLARQALAHHLQVHFAAIFQSGPNGNMQLLGSAPHRLRPLTAKEREHLTTGKLLLCVELLAPGKPLFSMVQRIAGNDEDLLVAELRNEKLFDAGNLQANGADVMILASDAQLLFSSADEVPEQTTLLHELRRSSASGNFTWQLRGEPQRAFYWRLFMQPQLGTDILVVQSRPAHLDLAPLRGFQWLFLCTAVLTLLFVLATSLVQIRRTLQPIAILRTATQQVAAGNLSAPVPIQSRDEFGELARSFDSMTRQLNENIQRRAVTEQQLVAARDQALAAARAKADFLTNVSHELRTPLTSILVYSEMLATGDTEPAVHDEFVSVIASQARHLNGLVEQVLDLTTSGSWETEPVHLTWTMQTAVATLPATRRARLRLVAPEALPQVQGATDRLVQLWLLLFDNALKFSAGETPVEVEARQLDDSIEVAITDHGCGIAAADQKRIFEPFCQLTEDILTAKAAGVGLGLTLAQNIVERLHGSITVHSVVGQGSTFCVRLPVAAAPVRQPVVSA